MKRKWNDDPFTKKARQENFLARSIYKLEEIDRSLGLRLTKRKPAPEPPPDYDEFPPDDPQ